MTFLAFEYSVPLIKARFVNRYKRFFSDVVFESPAQASKDVVTVHCANSGSMKSCNVPGAPARLYDSMNPERKLRYTLESLQLDDGWACLNTSRANQIVARLMEKRAGLSSESFAGADLFLCDFASGSYKPEVKFNAGTRFDGLFSEVCDSRTLMHWVEIKSVSLRLSSDEIAFPDAVTERGTKHLNELRNALQQEQLPETKATLIFAVMRGAGVEARNLASQFRIAHEIDSEYACAAREAAHAGVQFRLLIAGIEEHGLSVRGYYHYDPRNDLGHKLIPRS